MKSIFNILVIQILSLAVSVINSHIIHEQESGNEEYAGVGDLESILRENKVKKSVAIKNKFDLWEDGIIPYEIDDIFDGSQRTIFKRAMRMWEQFTCIQFIERDPKIHPDYVFITKLDCGCCFNEKMPRNNGRSELSLNDGCDKLHIVLHELGHVLGFYHEHQHPDRDQYVHINKQNVERGFWEEFSKFSSDQVDTLQQPYNYRSIMHYPRNAFAYLDFLDTIVPKQLDNGRMPKIGSYVRLSTGDIEATNRLYRCPTCCITAPDNNGTIVLPENNYGHCEWRIKASHGERIVLRIVTLNLESSPNHTSEYVEIRDGLDRFKSPIIDRYYTLESEIGVIGGNNMIVSYIAPNKNDGNSQFEANYIKICDNVIFLDKNGDTAYLESPNYPFNYESNKNCQWRISAPENHKVKIKFEFFSLESSDECVYDYLKVGDGYKQDSPIIGTYCGMRNPWEIISTGNSVYIKFISDDSNTDAGFSAFITAIDK